MAWNKKELETIASAQGYRIEIVEKVILLAQLLENLFKLPRLNSSFALKGGTALNLFYCDTIPRLSIDIDLNYIKMVDGVSMLQDREILEDALIRVCNQTGYNIRRHPRRHAGGKMTLEYNSVLGHKGRLEVDLNYMYRNPIFDVKKRDSHNWPYRVTGIPVLDIHELAAGKLHALFTRNAARDLFDAHRLFTRHELDQQKLRLAFVVYMAMSKMPWIDFNLSNINFDVDDFRNKLIPVINKEMIASQSENNLRSWATTMLNKVRYRIDDLLFPLTNNEKEFLTEVQENGKVYPRLICNDDAIIDRIKTHPNLAWRIQTQRGNKNNT